jgi:glutamate synthase (NADPH/NADH) small chain
MGFVSPVHDGMLANLKLDLEARGNVTADTESYQTSLDKVFACGDMRRGQSLVLWACPAKAARPRTRSTGS